MTGPTQDPAGWWDPDIDAYNARPSAGSPDDFNLPAGPIPHGYPAEVPAGRRVDASGAGALLLAAAGGAVAATALGLLVLLLGGVLVAIVLGGLVLLGAGALTAAHLRGGRS